MVLKKKEEIKRTRENEERAQRKKQGACCFCRGKKSRGAPAMRTERKVSDEKGKKGGHEGENPMEKVFLEGGRISRKEDKGGGKGGRVSAWQVRSTRRGYHPLSFKVQSHRKGPPFPWSHWKPARKKGGVRFERAN